MDSFHLPIYTPSVEEVRSITQREGSFNLERVETFDVIWGSNDNADNKEFVFDKHKSGRNSAKGVRAVTESLFVSHFGAVIIDDLFHSLSDHIAEHLSKRRPRTLS